MSKGIEQSQLCKKYDTFFVPCPDGSKVGITLNVRNEHLIINGLRHPPEGDTNGWYIWAGEELSNAHDFFMPLHIEHLEDWCPQVVKYLGLPPGWRFLIARDHEDVWEDKSLLNT